MHRNKRTKKQIEHDKFLDAKYSFLDEQDKRIAQIKEKTD